MRISVSDVPQTGHFVPRVFGKQTIRRYFNNYLLTFASSEAENPFCNTVIIETFFSSTEYGQTWSPVKNLSLSFRAEVLRHWRKGICDGTDLRHNRACFRFKLEDTVGMSLNPFPNKPRFLRVCGTSLLKTLWEMEKLHITSNYSFSLGVFYPFGKHSAIKMKFEIVICKMFQFRKV